MRIGLTGGIGAGKSEVARLLAEHGAVVIDADVLAREAVAPGSDGLKAVVDALGDGVLADDGSLDRAAVARIVFADPDKRAALNAIVHPYVRRRSEELGAAAPPGAVVVEDVPLLVESSLQDRYDLVVVVDASPDTQVRRLVDRGLTPDQARERMSAQASREARRAIAGMVINNDADDHLGDRASLRRQVDALWSRLTAGDQPHSA